MNKFLLHSSRLVSASVITDNLSLVEVISVLNKSKFEVTPSMFLNIMESGSIEFFIIYDYSIHVSHIYYNFQVNFQFDEFLKSYYYQAESIYHIYKI